MSKEDLNKETRILLKIYSEAQSSAQHHDQLVWVSVTLIIAGILVLTSSMVSDIIKSDKVSNPYQILILGIFVFVLSYIALFFASGYRNIKHNKYRILQNIEIELVRKYDVPWEYAQHLVLDGYEELITRLGEFERGKETGLEDEVIYINKFQPYKKTGWKLLRAFVWMISILWVILVVLAFSMHPLALISSLGVVEIEFLLIRHVDDFYRDLH